MTDLRIKQCPRCKRFMPVGNGTSLCSECEQKRIQKRKEQRDYAKEYKRRSIAEEPKYRRFYRSREWRMVSQAYSQHVGHRCEECGRIGTDVHHISPIQTVDGWERRFDYDNLKLLCVQCHNRAHGRTFGNGWSGNG